MSMRFRKSILLPLAIFAACCSTNTMAERRLRSDYQVQIEKENQSSGPPTGAVGLTELQEMDPEEVKKQIREVAIKLPIPPGFTVDSIVELSMASLGKSKDNPQFAAKLQKQTDEVKEKMQKRGITKIEDLATIEKKADTEDEIGGAK
uniref:Lipoprotein n=1 Tax=Peronospora matthiolae TaxID=2874970 RepID=A0AAV1U4M0_9STRA